MNSKVIVGVLILVALVVGVFVMTGDDDEPEMMDEGDDTAQVEQQEQTIVDLAVATPDLSTLVTAVQTADLVDTLNGDGPFTVFAPTNAAFEDLLVALDATVEELLARDDLADILTYHVVVAEAFSTDLTDGQEITTVNGGTLTVSIADGAVSIVDANGGAANVVTADVDASNGVVHVIDAVLLP